MSFDTFQREVRHWRSLEIVDKYLAVDPVSRFRASADRFARERALQEHLRGLITARAVARKVGYEVAADQYLDELAEKLPIEVSDERFHLPVGREVFK
jgi:hypothetical protein